MPQFLRQRAGMVEKYISQALAALRMISVWVYG